MYAISCDGTVEELAMNVFNRFTIALTLLLALAASTAGVARAQDIATPEATPAGTGTGAVFMTIANDGAEADTFLAAESTVASAVEIHETRNEGGVMQMRQLVDGLEIPAGETVALEPGGYHVMLIGLTADLVVGETFPLTLEFAQAGSVDVEVPVYATRQEASAAAMDDEITVGDLTISGIWSRQAPMMGAGPMHGQMAGTPGAGAMMATPAAGTQGAMAGNQGESMAPATGAVFMTITNDGEVADRLVAAETDVATTVEIHEVADVEGVMQMRPLEDGLTIEPGDAVELMPGGFHIMLIGLQQDLLAGETFDLSLTFEQAGDVTVTAQIVMGNDKPEEGYAEPATAGDITVSDVWSRAAPALQ
jgi:periplasmic copper chaperone A